MKCPKVINRADKILGIEREYILVVVLPAVLPFAVLYKLIGNSAILVSFAIAFGLWSLIFKLTFDKQECYLVHLLYVLGGLTIKGFPRGHKGEKLKIYNCEEVSRDSKDKKKSPVTSDWVCDV